MSITNRQPDRCELLGTDVNVSGYGAGLLAASHIARNLN